MRECTHCFNPLAGYDWHCHACGFLPRYQDGIACLSPRMLGHNDGYNEALFSEYERLVDSHFWFTGRLNLIIDTMRVHCPAPAAMLEIGCATGHVLAGIHKNFPGHRLTGAEPSIVPLKTAARRLPDAAFVQMDGRCIPWSNEFDVIGAFDVLEHIEEDELVLRQMHRACKHGGIIMLTVPQHRWLWSRTDVDAAHKRRYTRRELLHKVRAAGFHVNYVSSFMFLLLPAMVASRVMQRSKKSGRSPVDDGFKISPWLNRLFSLVFGMERLLLSVGIRFPVGGSLLLVARKIPQDAGGSGA